MAKKRSKPVFRRRTYRSVTLDDTIVRMAMKVAKQQMPPIKALSRLLDVAMVHWASAHAKPGEWKDFK